MRLRWIIVRSLRNRDIAWNRKPSVRPQNSTAPITISAKRLATNHLWLLVVGRIGDSPEVVEGEQAAAVAVFPHWLDGVAADELDRANLKRGELVRLLSPDVQVAHDIHFALATGAGAGFAQFGQAHE